MSLIQENTKPVEYELRKSNLRESLNKARKNAGEIFKKVEEMRHVAQTGVRRQKKLDSRFYV